jgi:hypothetical protein
MLVRAAAEDHLNIRRLAMSSLDKMLGWFPHTHRLAMKILNRAVLGALMASALLLSGLALCTFGAQANVPYSKIGVWSVAYLELDNLNGCGAVAQFPDQTVFQMVHIQSGTDKAWMILISNPRWNAWIGKRRELRLQLVTDWPTTKPWPPPKRDSNASIRATKSPTSTPGFFISVLPPITSLA